MSKDIFTWVSLALLYRWRNRSKTVCGEGVKSHS